MSNALDRGIATRDRQSLQPHTLDRITRPINSTIVRTSKDRKTPQPHITHMSSGDAAAPSMPMSARMPFHRGILVMEEQTTIVPFQRDETMRQPELIPGAPACPVCRSIRIEARHYGKKVGGTIGAVAGATSGVALVLSGAEIGAVAGAMGGPVGSAIGALTGGVLAMLIGGATGCAAGAAFGEIIDDNVLDKYRCTDCGYAFGAKPI